MTSYVDYTYYTTTYGGTKIPSASFNRIGLKASYQVANVLMGKDYTNYNDTDYTTNVKMATCSIADILYDEELATTNTNGKVITSESIGDYSRSFGNQESVTNETKRKVNSELFTYLGMSGLMHRGVDCVHAGFNDSQ